MVLGLGVGAAAVVGLVVYFLAGRRPAAGLAAAWLVLTGSGAALVPLVALAFNAFDVSRDTPA